MTRKATEKARPSARQAGSRSAKAKPTLLAGGNPQIAKADGAAPVRRYIEAMPGWKRDVGRRLDALIVRTVPHVSRAVRWNSPFYGIQGQGWFLNFHCLSRYIKVAFFNGTALRPLPPVESKNEGTRYFHIHEHEPIDEELLTSWVKQAARLPPAGKWSPSAGWVP
jgi:hypothetical protein